MAGARPATAGHLSVRPVALAETLALRRAVLRPHETIPELAAHDRPDAFAVGAYLGERLVAVGTIHAEGETPGDWRVRGMATAPRERGRGAGAAVLDALIAHAADHGATRVWCNARTPALGLYRRAGFVVDPVEFELPRIGPHHRAERRLC